MRVLAGSTAEIPPGARKILSLEGRPSIGVFNIRGRFYALKNTCPHQGAPLCLGAVTGTTVARPRVVGSPKLDWIREGEVITCPWHHWEFDIATGQTIFPSRNRVSTYDVSVELAAGVETYPVSVTDGSVFVELPDRLAQSQKARS